MKCTATDAEDGSLSAMFASSAEEPTANSATVGTLSWCAYQRLRLKLLQSSPQKKVNSGCSQEVRQKAAREAMEKKRIPKLGGKEIARRIYDR